MRIFRHCFSLFVLTACLAFRLDPSGDRQYVLKAALIYRFTEYTDWDSYPEDKFYISILGKSAISGELRTLARTRKIKNKEMVIKELNSIELVSFCHILFVPEESPIPIESIASKFKGWSTLIISEKNENAKKGAHINFVILDDKLKFEANMKAIRKTGLKISSNMLKHAIIVN